jgi:hypothetical protein
MRKNYKDFSAFLSMRNRGQVAIFVILAIVIVGIIVILYLFPGANIFVSQDLNPSSFLRDCIEPSVEEIVPVLALQGGYSQPDHFVTYQGNEIQYLCYTDQNYKPCIVQQPLLKRHFEEEIKNYVEPRARECVNELKDSYERRGFRVTSSPGDINVSFIPGSLVVDFLSPMTISKESSQTFRKFAVSVDSELYDLLLTSTSIIQFESTLGDSETTLYLQYYPDLKIEKIKRDSDTIYIVSDVVSGDSFRFATRSLVWPQGYGI